MFMVLGIMTSCVSEMNTSKDQTHEVVFGYEYVNSGYMTKSVTGITNHIESLLPVTLSLTVTPEIGESFTCNVGEPVELANGTYTVTCTYLPEGTNMNGVLSSNKPSFTINEDVEVVDNVREYKLHANYTCFAVVADKDEVSDMKFYDGSEYSLNISTFDTGLMSFITNFNSTGYSLNLVAKEGYDDVSFDLSPTEEDNKTLVENGKYYTFHPKQSFVLASIPSVEEPQEISPSTMGVDYPTWINGDNNYVENGVNYGKGISLGNVIWAPVNCGYEDGSYDWGKLYQWGRKVGFGYDSEYDTFVDATTPYYYTAIFKKDISEVNNEWFYQNLGYQSSLTNIKGDWIKDSNNQFWNVGTESSPKKSTYDPCPDGWRVPTATEAATLLNYTYETGYVDEVFGYMFDGKIFMPAAGFLQGDCGHGSGRNINGGYYTSTVSEDKAKALTFSSEGVVSVSDSYRASGFSVRCVKEK